MSKTIQKMVDFHKITTFSKKEYFIESEKIERLGNLLQNNKFITINWSLVNVASIDTIDPATPEEMLVANILHQQTPDVQNRVNIEIEKKKWENPYYILTENVLQKMIAKVKNLPF